VRNVNAKKARGLLPAATGLLLAACTGWCLLRIL